MPVFNCELTSIQSAAHFIELHLGGDDQIGGHPGGWEILTGRSTSTKKLMDRDEYVRGATPAFPRYF
jgi:hypothetical protein